MYKLLLCWRYLRMRYIALASIISVTLGVATMIVVNGVMAGFTNEMQQRLEAVNDDITFESHSLDGFPDPEWHKRKIREAAGAEIEDMTATVTVPAAVSFQVQGKWVTRPVQAVGIERLTGRKSEYLKHPENRRGMTFELREGGYDTRDRQGPADGADWIGMDDAGWAHRRRVQRFLQQQAADVAVQPGDAASAIPADAQDPFRDHQPQEPTFDPLHEQRTGLIMGIAIASFRDKEARDHFLIKPGDDVRLTLPNAGQPPRPVDDIFTIVDFYQCRIFEFDSNVVFVPLEKMQKLRGMLDPTTGAGFVTSIHIRLRDSGQAEKVRDVLRGAFDPRTYRINTWRDNQGTLLAAVAMETTILNVLLFLIIAVAGFGILAIFFMIVVEKTRDIGILKSLGASRRGIMGIFLGYGFSLGAVGAGAGLAMGLVIVAHINEIADGLAWLTGRPVFDALIYYFYSIPTIVEPWTVAWVVGGALGIAVAASVLPARRAARLHPVEALRYE